MDLNVKKRNGKVEAFDANKIHEVLYWATKDVKGVNISDIELNAKLQVYDNIPTKRLHETLIQATADLIAEDTPNYQQVAGNLLNYYLRKEVFGVSDNMPPLIDVIKDNIKNKVYDKEILKMYTEEEIDQLDNYIKHNRDYLFVYAALQQLADKYLLKDRHTGRIYETPQYMYIVMAMVLFSNYDKETRLRRIKSFYNDVSTFKISLPTPVMAGVRTPSRQYSSCTLIDVGDSLASIFHSNTAVGYYTANRAGIGLNFGRIRNVGSRINNGSVIHTGVIPFLKMFEATTKSCTQNGVRGGSSTTHFPFWHKEIQEILVLKNNRGTDDNRVRKMDYSIQFNRLFYKRFVEDKPITLFNPNEVQDLYDAFISDTTEFEKLYEEYENSRKVQKMKIPARKLFMQFCQERIETGRMYVMNMDHVNDHSSFLDPISMSNLCQEITLPTTPITHIDGTESGEIALCVLSAINVGQIKKLPDLQGVCENIVRALDYVIENQDYPVDAALNMKKRRSIGVGITNFAYYLAKNNVKYSDKEALELTDELCESIQFYLLKASVNLAKEKGKCEWFDRTKYSKGILPIDTYCKEVDKLTKRKLSHDWEELRKDIVEHGLRNSTLTALMPCESSSLVTNSTNGIEPPRSLVTVKKSKQGLIPQVVPEIARLKNKYTMAYDMENNVGYINLCAVMQKYFDQAISANHYYNFARFEEGNLPMSVVAKDILYSYKVGLKTLYYANTDDGKSDTTENEQDNDCAGGACKL